MDTNSSITSGIRSVMIVIAFIVVFIFPYGYHVDLGPGPNGLMAITWEFPENRGIMLFTALEYFPYYLYRLVVMYAIWKFSIGETKPKRLMVHGLASELIPTLISIPGALFLSSEGENFIPIMIPIPFLLLYCTVLAIYISKR